MSEFRYNRLLCELMSHLARRSGNMEIHLASLVPDVEARRSLMLKVSKYHNHTFYPDWTYDVVRINDLARVFAATYWNQEQPDGQ